MLEKAAARRTDSRTTARLPAEREVLSLSGFLNSAIDDSEPEILESRLKEIAERGGLAAVCFDAPTSRKLTNLLHTAAVQQSYGLAKVVLEVVEDAVTPLDHSDDACRENVITATNSHQEKQQDFSSYNADSLLAGTIHKVFLEVWIAAAKQDTEAAEAVIKRVGRAVLELATTSRAARAAAGPVLAPFLWRFLTNPAATHRSYSTDRIVAESLSVLLARNPSTVTGLHHSAKHAWEQELKTAMHELAKGTDYAFQRTLAEVMWRLFRHVQVPVVANPRSDAAIIQAALVSTTGAKLHQMLGSILNQSNLRRACDVFSHAQVAGEQKVFNYSGIVPVALKELRHGRQGGAVQKRDRSYSESYFQFGTQSAVCWIPDGEKPPFDWTEHQYERDDIQVLSVDRSSRCVELSVRDMLCSFVTANREAFEMFCVLALPRLRVQPKSPAQALVDSTNANAQENSRKTSIASMKLPVPHLQEKVAQCKHVDMSNVGASEDSDSCSVEYLPENPAVAELKNDEKDQPSLHERTDSYSAEAAMHGKIARLTQDDEKIDAFQCSKCKRVFRKKGTHPQSCWEEHAVEHRMRKIRVHRGVLDQSPATQAIQAVIQTRKKIAKRTFAQSANLGKTPKRQKQECAEPAVAPKQSPIPLGKLSTKRTLKPRKRAPKEERPYTPAVARQRQATGNVSSDANMLVLQELLHVKNEFAEHIQNLRASSTAFRETTAGQIHEAQRLCDSIQHISDVIENDLGSPDPLLALSD